MNKSKLFLTEINIKRSIPQNAYSFNGLLEMEVDVICTYAVNGNPNRIPDDEIKEYMMNNVAEIVETEKDSLVKLLNDVASIFHLPNKLQKRMDKLTNL